MRDGNEMKEEITYTLTNDDTKQIQQKINDNIGLLIEVIIDIRDILRNRK